MGLMDSLRSGLSGALNEAERAAVPGLISEALGHTQFGSLQGLVDHLQSGPLAQQVQSWVGPGSNLPVSADQIKQVLGNEQVRQLAAHFHLDPDKVADLLASHLPKAVEGAAQNGTVTTPQQGSA
jgi:uncharacterized protein YidB (DUF937 family)